MSWQQLAIGTRAAIVLVGLSFLITFEKSSSGSTNGVVTYCDYKDYGAILFGGLAVLAAVIGAAMNRQRDNLLFAGAAALTGLYSLAAGLGVIGSPCG